MTFTIITATYNRRRLLEQLFKSLVAQHYDQIEWIIIDDGGSDGTGDVIAEFQREADFSIRYVCQANGGKQVAVNLGLGMATGDLVAVIDDDDWFLPDVFSCIARDFTTIANSEAVAGLSYLCLDSAGTIWGRQFPRDRMISDHFECRINQNVWGDKCEFTKTRVLRENNIRFPTIGAKAGIAGDTLFLMQIANRYNTCYINMPVLVKVYLENGISVNWRKKALENPELTSEYYAGHLNSRVRLRIRFKYLVAYVAIESYAGNRIVGTNIRGSLNRVLFYLSYLPGRAIGAAWRRYRDGQHPLSRRWLRPSARPN
jgi:glycosyltransferase involved in cell wall biosynthesis